MHDTAGVCMHVWPEFGLGGLLPSIHMQGLLLQLHGVAMHEYAPLHSLNLDDWVMFVARA